MMDSIAVVGYRPYEKFLLKEGFYLGQIYTEGLVFARVQRKEYVRIDFDRVKIDQTTNSPVPLDPGEVIRQPVQLVDAQGRVLIGAQRGRGLVGYERTMFHFFYGISPARLRVYLQYTLATPRGNLNTRAQAPGDFFGFYDGLQSPTFNPSVQTELFVPYNLDWGLVFHNPTARKLSPLIQFLGERYYLDFLHPEKPGQAQVINRILKGQIPVRLATIGRGLYPVDYQAGGVGTSWPRETIPWNAVDADKLDRVPGPGGE